MRIFVLFILLTACGSKTSPGSGDIHDTGDHPSGWQVISAGQAHSCGVDPEGQVRCWGRDHHGQSTVAVTELVDLATGLGHTCGLQSDGSIACWGLNISGQSSPPSQVLATITAGSAHTCGLDADGSGHCWGADEYGQGSAKDGSFDALTSGGWHNCGIRSSGKVICWGWDEYGQATAPSGDFVSVDGGGWHTCGIRTDGSLLCWGDEISGQLDVPSGTFTQVSAGWQWPQMARCRAGAGMRTVSPHHRRTASRRSLLETGTPAAFGPTVRWSAGVRTNTVSPAHPKPLGEGGHCGVFGGEMGAPTRNERRSILPCSRVPVAG